MKTDSAYVRAALALQGYDSFDATRRKLLNILNITDPDSQRVLVSAFIRGEIKEEV